MEQVQTGPITSDRDLLDRLRLTDVQAADILARTTRAWLKQRLARDKCYFRAHDIVMLRATTQMADMSVDETGIVDYVLLHHGQKSADYVQAAFDLMSAPPQLEALQEIWVIISDLRHLEETGHMEGLRALLQLPAKLIFLFGSPLQERDLKKFFGEEAITARVPMPIFKSENFIGAQPSLLLGNPMSDSVNVYCLALNGRCVRNPEMSPERGALYAKIVREHVWLRPNRMKRSRPTRKPHPLEEN